MIMVLFELSIVCIFVVVVVIYNFGLGNSEAGDGSRKWCFALIVAPFIR